MTAEEFLAAPLVVRTCPIFWTDESKVLEGLDNPQLRLFWAQKLNLVKRKKKWFGKGWKLKWKAN